MKVARYSFQPLELPCPTSLSSKQLLVEPFTHGEHEPAWNAFGDQLSRLANAYKLTKDRGIESVLTSCQN
jgi:hypothetical protein